MNISKEKSIESIDFKSLLYFLKKLRNIKLNYLFIRFLNLLLKFENLHFFFKFWQVYFFFLLRRSQAKKIKRKKKSKNANRAAARVSDHRLPSNWCGFGIDSYSREGNGKSTQWSISPKLLLYRENTLPILLIPPTLENDNAQKKLSALLFLK